MEVEMRQLGYHEQALAVLEVNSHTVFSANPYSALAVAEKIGGPAWSVDNLLGCVRRFVVKPYAVERCEPQLAMRSI